MNGSVFVRYLQTDRLIYSWPSDDLWCPNVFFFKVMMIKRY